MVCFKALALLLIWEQIHVSAILQEVEEYYISHMEYDVHFNKNFNRKKIIGGCWARSLDSLTYD